MDHLFGKRKTAGGREKGEKKKREARLGSGVSHCTMSTSKILFTPKYERSLHSVTSWPNDCSRGEIRPVGSALAAATSDPSAIKSGLVHNSMTSARITLRGAKRLSRQTGASVSDSESPNPIPLTESAQLHRTTQHSKHDPATAARLTRDDVAVWPGRGVHHCSQPVQWGARNGPGPPRPPRPRPAEPAGPAGARGSRAAGPRTSRYELCLLGAPPPLPYGI